MTEQEKNTDSSTNLTVIQNLVWWATLIIAVIAVPSIAFIIAAALPLQGLTGIAMFMIVCWLCTFLGMKLMSGPPPSKK